MVPKTSYLLPVSLWLKGRMWRRGELYVLKWGFVFWGCFFVSKDYGLQRNAQGGLFNSRLWYVWLSLVSWTQYLFTKKWSKSCESREGREISGKAEAVLALKYVGTEVHPWVAPAEMLITGLLTPIILNLFQFSCQDEWYFQSYSK